MGRKPNEVTYHKNNTINYRNTGSSYKEDGCQTSFDSMFDDNSDDDDRPPRKKQRIKRNRLPSTRHKKTYSIRTKNRMRKLLRRIYKLITRRKRNQSYQKKPTKDTKPKVDGKNEDDKHDNDDNDERIDEPNNNDEKNQQPYEYY